MNAVEAAASTTKAAATSAIRTEAPSSPGARPGRWRTGADKASVDCESSGEPQPEQPPRQWCAAWESSRATVVLELLPILVADRGARSGGGVAQGSHPGDHGRPDAITSAESPRIACTQSAAGTGWSRLGSVDREDTMPWAASTWLCSKCPRPRLLEEPQFAFETCVID